MWAGNALDVALLLQNLVQEAARSAVSVEDVDFFVARLVGAYPSTDFFRDMLGVVMQLGWQTGDIEVTPAVPLDQINDFACKRTAGNK